MSFCCKYHKSPSTCAVKRLFSFYENGGAAGSSCFFSGGHALPCRSFSSSLLPERHLDI